MISCKNEGCTAIGKQLIELLGNHFDPFIHLSYIIIEQTTPRTDTYVLLLYKLFGLFFVNPLLTRSSVYEHAQLKRI